MKRVRKAVFPVAGLGTRFLPATKSSSKEMLPVVDKPLIHYGVMDAIKAGIELIVFVTGRGKRAIEDYFDISFELEYHLRTHGKGELAEQMRGISNMADFVYIRQKEPRGLGHAVLRARDIIGDEPFAVILPDEVMDGERSATAQLVEVFDMYQCSVLGLQEVEPKNVDKYGIVDGIHIDERLYKLEKFVEKPRPEEAPSNLAIVGRYILTPRVFEELERTECGKHGEIQLTDAIASLNRKEAVYGYILDVERYDCGNKLGLIKATVKFALKDEEIKDELKKYLREVIDAG